MLVEAKSGEDLLARFAAYEAPPTTRWVTRT